MADKTNQQSRPTPLGIYDKPQSGGVTGIEVVAVILSAIWLIGAAAVFLILGEMASQISLDAWGQVYPPFLITVLLVVILDPAIYWLNQLAVKHHLEPQKRELEEVLRELEHPEAP